MDTEPAVAIDNLLTVHPAAMKRLEPYDIKTILETCSFVSSEHSGAEQVNAKASLLYHLGVLSSGTPPSHAGGPVAFTCSAVSQIYEGCNACKHRAAGTPTVFHIKDDSFISSSENGFFVQSLGRTPSWHVCAEDAVKQFDKDGPFRVIENTRLVYIYTGKHWKDQSWNHTGEYYASILKHPTRPIKNADVQECLLSTYRTNVVSDDMFAQSCYGLVNFQNGVLRLNDKQLLPHSSAYGFKGVLDYSFDPSADCPMFKKFLSEISCESKEIEQVLQEFSGYAVCGFGDYSFQKALLLYGPKAANGKSTLLDIVTAVCGESNTSSLDLHQINNENSRLLMLVKMLNTCRETNPDDLEKSEVFKKAISGEPLTFHKFYTGRIRSRNTAKIIFACNELPRSADKTDGIYRRLLIVPMNRTFVEGKDEVKNLAQKIIKDELPGIFNFLLEGYERLVARGSFEEKQALTAAMDEFKYQNNNFLQWKQECVNYDADLAAKKIRFTKRSSAYKDYKDFTTNNGGFPYKNITFSKFAKDHFGEPMQGTGQDKGLFGWYGMMLNSEIKF